MNRLIPTFLIALICSSVLCVPAGAQVVDNTVVKGTTVASSRRLLNFVNPGVIGKVSVEEGDAVKAGQLLMKQDDRIELKRLEGLRLEADQSLVIKAKQKQKEFKEAIYQRKKEAYAKQAASESEVKEAQLDAELAGIEVELAERDGVKKTAEADLQALKVEQMTLNSPVNGFVLKIDLREGENVDAQHPVITIVSSDPIYIEVKQAKKEIVDKLNIGQELDIRLPGNKDWQKAKIRYISPEGDARAGMLMFRMEMPNPAGLRPGDECEVKMP